MRTAKLCVVLCVMLLATGSAKSQTGKSPVQSEPCQAVVSSSLEALEKRKQELEEAIASTRVQVEAGAPIVTDDASSKAITNAQAELKAKQNSLIGVLFQLECFRTDLQRPPEIIRSQTSVVEITTFYATNRRPTGRNEPSSYYGADDTRELAYGRASVSIPSEHKIGELELPTLWRLEFSPNPNRHFLLKSVVQLPLEDAKQQISTALRTATQKSLLIFVHGYNVNFSEAALRTAQLAYDLRFPGLAMFYSWPSMGERFGYLHDEESSQLATIQFDQLLSDMSKLSFEQIYLVAHSMGTRIVGSTLARRALEGKDDTKIKEILLAAPDINAEIFKTEIAPKLAAMEGARKTIYASSKDLALKASKVMHRFSRLGETDGRIFISPGFDTIDASGAAALLRAFGHSYVLDSASVLNDVEDIVVWRRLIAERTLRKMGIPPSIYWGLR
jgi:esterase/lipase superfamily enzyme